MTFFLFPQFAMAELQAEPAKLNGMFGPTWKFIWTEEKE
jgi:hypothetical protein